MLWQQKRFWIWGPVLILAMVLAGCEDEEKTLLQEQLTAAEEQVQSLQKQLAAEKASVAQLTENLRQAENDKETALAECRQAQEQLKKVEEQNSHASAALETLKKASEGSRKAIMERTSNLSKQVEELQTQLDAEKVKNAELQKSVSSNYATTANVIQHYKNQQAALEQKITSLEQELAELKK
ncbi:MAG: hypothetical protein JW709_11200 [Sedimentisphaerales bacterium]|nr:hypothetical protein [Sedimentisphaerales bacterium]